MKLKITLVDDWQKLRTHSSVLFSGAVAVVAPLGAVLRETWNSMPDDLKQYLPHSVQQAISYSILCLTFLALRYTTVRRVPREDVDGPH